MNTKYVKSDENKKVDQMITQVFDDSDFVYETVLSKLDLPEGDDVYRALVMSTLRQQAKDHMIFSIWNNLNPKQALHLRDYLAQTKVFADFLTTDDAVMEFALMYPLLLDKVYASLANFFIEFIKKFNRYKSA